MAVPQYEEWRLTLVLPPADLTAGRFADEVRSRVPADVEVYRRGRRGIRLYAGERTAIDAAEQCLRDLLDLHRIRTPVRRFRWDPAEERWQSPLLPAGRTFKNLPAEWADLDDAAWEIRMKFRDAGEANYVAERLRRNGAPVISDGLKRIMVGVESESAARQKTAELRLLAGRATFTVRPLSHFRRWLLRQGMVGNYSDASAEGWQQRRTRELNAEEGV